MTTDGHVPELSEPGEPGSAHGWLYNHIGRISGTLLGLFAFFAIAFLAAIGSKPALGLLVCMVFGVVTIAIGGRMRQH